MKVKVNADHTHMDKSVDRQQTMLTTNYFYNRGSKSTNAIGSIRTTNQQAYDLNKNRRGRSWRLLYHWSKLELPLQLQKVVRPPQPPRPTEQGPFLTLC